jgi:hypothetical protein
VKLYIVVYRENSGGVEVRRVRATNSTEATRAIFADRAATYDFAPEYQCAEVLTVKRASTVNNPAYTIRGE